LSYERRYTQRKKPADIDADTLRNFIFDLYLRNPQLSDKIEVLILANDPITLSRVLRKRIASLPCAGTSVQFTL
jgi:hypothetical protein